MAIKLCVECGQEFDRGGNWRYCCAECKRTAKNRRNAAYRHDPVKREQIRQRMKQYNARPDVRERSRVRGAEYYQRHRKERLEYGARYRTIHPKRATNNQRAYFAKICARLKCRGKAE